MPRSREASIAAALKAAKTIRRKKTAHRTALRIKKNTIGVSGLLSDLKKASNNETCCNICGEAMQNCLDIHHIDGNRKNNDKSNKIKICASCHRILDKAKSPVEALSDLKKTK